MPTIYIPLQCSLVHKIKYYVEKILMIILSILFFILTFLVNILTIVCIMALPIEIARQDLYFCFVTLIMSMVCMIVDWLILSLICDHFNIKFECIHNGD